MEYIIYCDESISKGQYFSDFYGGALVRSSDFNQVKNLLDAKKQELDLLNEIKWTRVSAQYLDKYKQMMTLFFDLIREDKIKIRIMFRQNALVPVNLNKEQVDNGFHLLYYQFVKHAFGLRYHCENPTEDTYLRLYFDLLPATNVQNEAFKSHIYGLQGLKSFQQARIKIRLDDIVEIDSKKHSIQQCMDIVLGAMAFRQNNLHKEKPEGARCRGKRTIAKEKLYKHILQLIRTLEHPNFNIGISTGGGTQERWSERYRHWCFKPREFREDAAQYKH